MKKEKQLKLDTLSSSELANKEANQIRGGATTICYCYCTCNTNSERFALHLEDKSFLRTETSE
jgi:natural product precursor